MHGNRNQPSPRRLAAAVRDEIVTLAEGMYRDYNDQHLTEVLQEEHGLAVSRASVRRVRRAAGLVQPEEVSAAAGTSAAGTLRAGRDAAADGCLAARMAGRPRSPPGAGRGHRRCHQRGGQCALSRAGGCGRLLPAAARHRQRHGLPLAIYADRHTIFQSPKQPTIEQELAGEVPRSQFGRLLAELDIGLIAAHSPQAKGRIERLWQTFQDRLVKELRQAGATTLAEANQVLADYLPKFNQRFMVARRPARLCLPPAAGRSRSGRSVFAFHYQRRVANDHTISLDGHTLQLPPLAHGRSYAKATVDLHHRLDGRLAVCYQGQLLATFEPAQPGPPRVEQFCPLPRFQAAFSPASCTGATSSSDATGITGITGTVRLPASNSPSGRKPPANHPWRRSYKDMQRAAPPLRTLPPHLVQGQSTDIFTEP